MYMCFVLVCFRTRLDVDKLASGKSRQQYGVLPHYLHLVIDLHTYVRTYSTVPNMSGLLPLFADL
jgi:hypothetical protein